MEKTGKDQFIESSDRFFGKVADFLDAYEIHDGIKELEKLKEVCDVVRITSVSIKALTDGDKPKKSGIGKLKNKASDAVV